MRVTLPYDLVTFDCYGTLVDWETGISEAVLAAARPDGVRLEREAILAAYADDDLLALTCRHFSVRFDLLVTAEQVRSYQPQSRTAGRPPGSAGGSAGPGRAGSLAGPAAVSRQGS